MDNKWEITDKLKCRVEIKNGIRLVYVLKPGVTTNFRSGPSFLDCLAPKIGICNIAVSWLIHDVNYCGYISRHMADYLLYSMLIKSSLHKWRCLLVYIGVRIFGLPGYNKKGKDNVNFIWFDPDYKYSSKCLNEVPKKVSESDKFSSFRRERCECVLKSSQGLNSEKKDPDQDN